MSSPSPSSSGTATKSGRVHRRPRRRTIQRPKVLQLLRNVMDKDAETPQTHVEVGREFYFTGRVGRRNAMPDILDQNCHTSTADLPDQLRALSTMDADANTSTPPAPTKSEAGCSPSAKDVSKSPKPESTSNS